MHPVQSFQAATHERRIALSVTTVGVLAATLNSSLKLEIASLRNPMRIDVIARRQLGLTEPPPAQVQEYDAPAGAEVAVAKYNHKNRAR